MSPEGNRVETSRQSLSRWRELIPTLLAVAGLLLLGTLVYSNHRLSGRGCDFHPYWRTRACSGSTPQREDTPEQEPVALMIFATKMVPESCALVRSAVANGLQVQIVGWRRDPKQQLNEHVTRTVAREYARRLAQLKPNLLVVGLDGYDTIMSRAATTAEIVNRFHDFGSSFVWSAEVNLFPGFESMPPEVQRDYPGQWPQEWHAGGLRWKKPPYPYLNFGGWVGRAGKAAEVMAAASKHVSPCAPHNESLHPAGGCAAAHDQHAGQLALVEPVCLRKAQEKDEGDRCTLDFYGSFFYSGWPNCSGLVPHASGYWANTVAGNVPLVVHFNGDAKTECMKTGVKDYMYSKRTGWYNRVPVDPLTPVYLSTLTETYTSTFGAICGE